MDEDETVEPIICPLCKAAVPCDHVLAWVDSTFFEFDGYIIDRIEEFYAPIQTEFARRLLDGQGPKASWKGSGLDELYECAAKDFDSDRSSETTEVEVVLNDYGFYPLIMRLFDEAGAVRYSGDIESGGGPGFASAMSLFFAADPEKATDDAVSRLKALLGG